MPDAATVTGCLRPRTLCAIGGQRVRAGRPDRVRLAGVAGRAAVVRYCLRGSAPPPVTLDDALRKVVDVHLLFVCTGNVCRSPTAERLVRAYAARLGIPDVEASSAGTQALTAQPISPGAAPVLRRLGGDPSGFAARQLTAKVAMSADLVLTMTEEHRDAVLRLAPRQLGKTFLLSEAAKLATDHGVCQVADLASVRFMLTAQDRPDIRDPFGREADVYAAVGEQIAQLLPPILELCRRTGC